MRLSGIRVLVVEDEGIVCMMIEAFLSDLGCQVVATAAELQDGLSKAERLAIDAAVLDINLDGHLSYPIAEMLRGRAIPFVFATGYGKSGVPQTFNTVPVLSKPFGPTELEKALTFICQGKIIPSSPPH